MRETTCNPKGRFSLAAAIALATVLPIAAPAQAIMGGNAGAPRLFGTDMAVLEAGEPRKDLPCSVDHEKAVLGFDLRFHAAYDVNVPLRELSGSENLLTILFRVTKLGQIFSPMVVIKKDVFIGGWRLGADMPCHLFLPVRTMLMLY